MKLYQIESNFNTNYDKIKAILKSTKLLEDSIMNQDRLSDQSLDFRFIWGDIMADFEMQAKILVIDIVPYDKMNKKSIQAKITKAITYRPLKFVFSSKNS